MYNKSIMEEIVISLHNEATEAREEAIEAGVLEELLLDIIKQQGGKIGQIAVYTVVAQDHIQLLRDLAANPMDPEKAIEEHKRQRKIGLTQALEFLQSVIDDSIELP